MGFIRKTCPGCKYSYETRSTHDYAQRYGSPFRQCPKCTKFFIDNDYVELGLTTIENIEPSINAIIFGGGKVINYIFATPLLLFGLYGFYTGEEMASVALLISAILIGLCLIDVIPALFLRNRYNLGFYVEYKKSLLRLLDVDYATALKRVGYNVPSQFLREEEHYQIMEIVEMVDQRILLLSKSFH